MKFLYILAKILTPIVRFCVRIGNERLEHSLSDKLDMDLSHIVGFTSSYLNKFWDIYNGNYPQQPHHKLKDILKALFRGIFLIIKLVLLSFFLKNQKSKTRN